MIYSKKRAGRAVKFTIILRSIAQLLSLIVTVLLVRLLTEIEFGVYNTLIFSLSLIGAIFSFGIDNTLQRYIPKYATNGEFSLVKRIVNIAFIVRLVSLTILCFIGYQFRFDIASLFNLSPYVALTAPFVFIVILFFQSRLLVNVLNACLLQSISLSAQMILVVVKVFLYLVMGEYEIDLKLILLADVIAYSLMILVLIIGYSRTIIPMTGDRVSFRKKESRDILKYSAYYNLNDIGVISLGRDISIFFIASMISLELAGAYAFANRLSQSIMQISPVRYFIDVIRPLFFTIDYNKEPKKLELYFSLLIKLNYFFELPIICALYVFFPYIVEYIFDGKFIEYRFLVIAVFFLFISSSLGIYIGLVAQLKERANIIFFSKLFSILNIIGNLVLIPIIGVFGAIVSTFITTLLKDLFVFYFVRDEMELHSIEIFMLISIPYWLIVSIVSNALCSLIKNDFLSIILGLCLCAISYYIFIKIKLFNIEESKVIKNLTYENSRILKFMGL